MVPLGFVPIVCPFIILARSSLANYEELNDEAVEEENTYNFNSC